MGNFFYSGIRSTDLMSKNAAIVVVVVTGLIINLRFLLYSAAMAPYLKEETTLRRFLSAFTLTDQSYASVTANQDKFQSNRDAVDFYLGTAAGMFIVWQSGVIAGYVFGNFAPPSISLDFAIPLSFVALLLPTLRRTGHKVVAAFSSIVSIAFYQMPLKTGPIVTALLSIALSWFIVYRRRHRDK